MENISLPRGWRLILKRETSSTNEDVMALPAGYDKTAVCAEIQTGGRGRMGRRWVSPEGNLYVSFCVELQNLREAEIYSFLSAVALAEAIEDVCTGMEIKCKWPNDLLVDGKKVSGILLETDGVGRLVAGIGVNIAAFPESGTLYPVTSLTGCGHAVTRENVLEALLKRFDFWRNEFENKGKTPVLEAWLKRAYGLGGKITVNLPDKRLEGTFDGLDKDGRLLLNKDGEIIAITAGDVFFGGKE